MEQTNQDGVHALARQIDAEIAALLIRNTPAIRAIRRRHSTALKARSPAFVLDLARALWQTFNHRWVAYELIAAHPQAFRSLDEAALEALGQGIDSWWTVDAFARTLAGPAWRDGLVADALIHCWAHASDCWRRRAALVCTVALNVRSCGGRGDAPRTLAVCRLLVDDHDEMVAKAMSWALRELVVHDPQAVQDFLAEYDSRLAARVRREVKNKLRTGLKNPRTQPTG